MTRTLKSRKGRQGRRGSGDPRWGLREDFSGVVTFQPYLNARMSQS